jgi:hypothetical protein
MLVEMFGNVRPNEERLSEGQRRHTAINSLSTNNLASKVMVLILSAIGRTPVMAVSLSLEVTILAKNISSRMRNH